MVSIPRIYPKLPFIVTSPLGPLSGFPRLFWDERGPRLGRVGQWPVKTRLRLVQLCVFGHEGQCRILLERKSATSRGCKWKMLTMRFLALIGLISLFRTWTECRRCKGGRENMTGADLFRSMVPFNYSVIIPLAPELILTLSKNILGRWILKIISSCRLIIRLHRRPSNTTW